MSIEQNQTKRVRVLIADDNKEMRDTVVRLLENDFEIVAAVGDGRALVDAARKLDPDAAIVDISMPILNGIEAVAEIKKHNPNMKAIFLTVNEDADFVRAAFDVGGLAYVVKRQMATDLHVALRHALAGETFISPGCDFPGAA
jgi:DNA-binding NarL/FixJ family response regulator